MQLAEECKHLRDQNYKLKQGNPKLIFSKIVLNQLTLTLSLRHLNLVLIYSTFTLTKVSLDCI